MSRKAILMLIIISLIGITLITAACSNNETNNTTTANINVGQQLYQENCASCHAPNAAGGIKVGDDTSPDIRFTELNEMYKGNWSLAKSAILDGKGEEGNDLDPAMPRWRGKLSSSQVDDIIAYLQSLK